MKKVLEGVETLNKLPGALFVVDIKKESIAVKEAKKLNIPVFAIVDTNCDPDEIDSLIPANDDAVKTIELIVKYMADSVLEGQAKLKEIKAEEAAERERVKKEREKEKESESDEKEKTVEASEKSEKKVTRKRKTTEKKSEKDAAPKKEDAEKSE